MIILLNRTFDIYSIFLQYHLYIYLNFHKTTLTKSGDLATTIFHYLDNQGRNNNKEEEEVQRDTSPSRSEILSKSSSTCNLILISRFHKRELYQEYVDLLKPGKMNIQPPPTSTPPSPDFCF